VVPVASAIVANGRNIRVRSEQLFERLARHVGAFEGSVQVVDVSLVVLGVVNLHRLRINMGLQSAVRIGEVRKCKHVIEILLKV
jgi:hypothetical protein